VSQRGAQVLLVGTPVVADNRVVGALLLGREVSGALASQLRDLTRSEVTFLSDHVITRTTLAESEDREVAPPRGLATRDRRPPRRSRTPAGWRSCGRCRWQRIPRPRSTCCSARSRPRRAFLRSVRGHLVELGLLLLAAVATASLFIAGHITHPIRQLVIAASAMERGEWEVTIDRDREDEMGYLARRFDDMRRRQRNYVRSLQEVARAKSEFIAVASHELRTPISIIRGWEDLLRGESREVRHAGVRRWAGRDRSRVPVAEKIAVSATRMAQSDGSEGPPAPALCDVEPLLGDALREATAAAPDRR
jgi:signal transduction histidine kinase